MGFDGIATVDQLIPAAVKVLNIFENSFLFFGRLAQELCGSMSDSKLELFLVFRRE